MSLNVNYNSLYKNGIDTSVLKDIPQKFFRGKSSLNLLGNLHPRLVKVELSLVPRICSPMVLAGAMFAVRENPSGGEILCFSAADHAGSFGHIYGVLDDVLYLVVKSGLNVVRRSEEHTSELQSRI